MLRKMKTYQFCFIAIMLIIWSVFSYKANANKYYEGEFRDSMVVEAIFSPNEETDHVATFTFPDSKVIVIKPVTKEVFTAFHSNGQEPLEVSLFISEQELELPPSDMIIISQVVGVIATFFAIICLIVMCFSKKGISAEEKRQKLKSRV